MCTSLLPIPCLDAYGDAWTRGALFVVLLLGLGWSGQPGTSRAQRSGPVGPSPGGQADTTQPLVQSVEVDGNEHFSDRELKRQIRTRPNRRVLGIPGFTWWRWIYQLGDADWMWGRLGNALKSGGEPPARLDTTTVAGDIERLRLFYEQQGFREATVEFQVRTSQPDRAVVVFRVDAGTPTYLRRVRYDGLEGLSDERVFDLNEEVSVNEKLSLIEEFLESRGEFLFTDLIQRRESVMDLVCAFLAILEAVKSRRIRLYQNRMFGDIRIGAWN